MWVKLEKVIDNERIIYLPVSIAKRLNNEIRVSFGKKTSMATVVYLRNLPTVEDNSFENPQSIKVSSKLASSLCLPQKLTCQIKYNASSMVIGPTIGLLLGRHNYLYSPEHMEKYSDRFGIYNQIGGLIYAFSYRTIDWNNKTVYGLYYNNEDSKWQYGKFPLPSVIYRRDFHTDPVAEKKLISAVQGNIFNSWRFSKLFLYEHVKKNKELEKYLPKTEYSKDYKQIKEFIDRAGDIILKPNNLSRGRGICIIKKDKECYRILDYRKSVSTEMEIKDEAELEAFFKNNSEFFDSYLIQQHLKLAKVNGGAFDIRVVMQKEDLTKWKCTGIECRVAAPKNLITNISKGGYALSLEKALAAVFPEDEEKQKNIKEEVYDLCFKLCKSLEETGKHFAEFGMDIAVDEQGQLWIIEVNVFPSFKGFKVMNYDTYLDIRHTPILYAARLAGF